MCQGFSYSWYSLDSSHWALSDEYPYARVPVIFRLFASFCYGQISHYQHKGYALMLKSNSKLLSGSFIVVTITDKRRVILENIWRRVVGSVLIKISPSNIFISMLSPEKIHQICQASSVIFQIFVREVLGFFWLTIFLYIFPQICFHI